MSKIQVKKNSSDISIDSWTLVDENFPIEDEKPKELSSSSNEIIEIEPEIVKEEEVGVKNITSDGFLAFDEFLQERLLEQDYEYVEKPQKTKKSLKNKKKGDRKCKAQNMGISVFITIILALTAFATLCSTLSQPLIETELDEAIRVDTDPSNEEIMKRINDTLKGLEEMKSSKLLEEMESKLKNSTFQQCSKYEGPLPEIKIKPPPFMHIPHSHPKVKPFKSESLKKILNKSNRSKGKNSKSKWMMLKELLMDTNIHALVSLIMTNIYLFTLLADFARRPGNCHSNYQIKQQLLEDLENNNNVEELRKYLFRELPFWNEDFNEKLKVKKTSTKSSNTTKSNIKPSKKFSNLTVLNENKSSGSVVFRSCPFLAKETSYYPLAPTTTDDSGKSECQRRFEALDLYQRKFENLKQTQKNRIKLLKQKYKNEVSFIRDNEEESHVRAEKINKTSQRFIKKLKYNRERYLMELKKVRELRQKVADAKKNDKVKDAATGTYTLSLPTVYDYGEKFKMIKKKFELENNQLPKWKFQ